MAGHSKFKNIMHRKGAQDKKRAKIFSRLGKEISVAVKENGHDPEKNIRLRSAIGTAKSLNMPKENIERAMKKGEGNDPNNNYEEVRYEGYGPDGVAIIVEAMTNNKNRTAAEIRSSFSKYGGNLGETGVASHQFKQVGMIRIDKKKISEEKMLELAINSGAEDCSSESFYHEVITTKENFNKVKLNIEKKIKDFVFSGIEWMPINKILLDEEKTKSVLNFLTMLEDDDDIQHVYANLEIDNAKLEKVLIFNGRAEIISPISPNFGIVKSPCDNDKAPAFPVLNVKPFMLGTTYVSPGLINLVIRIFPSKSSISTQLLPVAFKTISLLGSLSFAMADISLVLFSLIVGSILLFLILSRNL